MKREIYLEIESCNECPYCEYDSYYSLSSDSGYDCSQLHERIVNDWQISSYSEKLKIWEDSQKTLFKKSIEEKPVSPFTIWFENKCTLKKIN
ncbi:hypothetical protein M0Q50_01885 [bacterium]|jgi:hypothetical protein|nr:hypothetical protein [bacterium]